MPDFLGLGAQKAGTTWLYHALAHHPCIAMPDCKEVHFWDQHYDRGYVWYEGQFDRKRISGEITPAYAILPPATVAEIAKRYPALKLLYLVRDPMERAWSAARMDFAKTGQRYEETADSWFLEHFRSQASRTRGDYLTCTRNWLDAFPKEQLLLLDYAAIKTDPRGLLKVVAQHLGADTHFFTRLHGRHLVSPRNEGGAYLMRPAFAAELEKIYAGKYEKFRNFVKKERLDLFSA